MIFTSFTLSIFEGIPKFISSFPTWCFLSLQISEMSCPSFIEHIYDSLPNQSFKIYDILADHLDGNAMLIHQRGKEKYEKTSTYV